MKRLLALIIVALASITPSLYSQLTWMQAGQKIETYAGGSSIEITFSYRNETAKRINIKSVTPSCNCTAVVQYVAMVESGARGEWKLRYTPGITPGISHKVINIDSDSGAQQLGFDVALKPWYEVVGEKFLLWKSVPGEIADGAKSFRVQVPNGAGATLEIQATPGFSLTTRQLKEGDFRVTVSPELMSSPAKAVIKFKVKSQEGKLEAQDSIFVAVEN